MNIIKLVGKTLTTNSKRSIKKFILKNIYFDRFVDTYDSWIIANFPDILDIENHKNEIKHYKYRPLISITVPTYNTPILFLHECIRSVITQSYENWELILIDDASSDDNVRRVIKDYAKKDNRIKYKFLKNNHHIAGATNEAIKISKGDYVGLFDHDDILWPNALYEVVKSLNDDNTIDFIYTDEDKIVEIKSKHSEPFFKPDWNPQLLRTCNYITHFSVFRRELLDKVGFERGDYNGAQDWEMIMRASRQAKNIHHIPKILYSWRVHDNSTAKDMGSKPYVTNAQKATIEDDLVERGYCKDDFNVSQDKDYFAFWRTLLNTGNPKVSVIVTSKSQAISISRKTAYKNIEYIVSKKYKEGVIKATGEYIVFVEPGIKIKSSNWIETLVSSAVQDNSGAVGGLITHSNKGFIYSAGLYVNKNGKLAHALSDGVEFNHAKTLTRTVYINTKRNVTALCGFIMIRKDKIDKSLIKNRLSYLEQLIVLSLSLAEKGFDNIYDPKVIGVINKKFYPKPKNVNKDQKRKYYDKELHLITKIDKYNKALRHNYFYDDLVSCPDLD